METKTKPTANKTHTHGEQTQTHGEQTHDKPTASKWRANRKPPTQIATTETQDQHTETQIANRKSPTQLPPKSASHHHWNPNRNPLTKIPTHQPNLNPLLPNHKTHYWSTAPPIHCQKIERERVQERIKKKEQCEKKVIDFLGYGLMMDVLGFNLNDGFNFEFVFLGLIFWVCVLVLFVFWNLNLCLVMVCAFMFLCWFLNLWSYSCSKWIRSKLMYFIVFNSVFSFFI